MKFLLNLFNVFIVVLISSGVYCQHIQPVNTLQIPYATETIVVDGVDDEAYWSEEQTTEVFRADGWSGVSDYTLTFKVCYDENYLYVFAKILDDYNNSWDWGLSNQWTFDNVEVFFDLDTNESGLVWSYDTNTVQIRFNRGVDSVNDWGHDVSRADYLYYWENNADGWLFETGIPWKFVLGWGQQPEDIMQYFEEGVRCGFEVMGADSDTDGPDMRDVQTAWDEDGEAGDYIEDNAWNNRCVFGIVEFLPDGGIPINSAYISPVKKMDIPARTDFINIDGSDTEGSYSAAQSLSLFNNEGVVNSNDLSGTFKTTYDAKYLYFFSKINDNIVNNWPGEDALQDLYDNLELYIDLDTNLKSSSYDDNTQMFRFHRGVDTLSNYGNAVKEDFIIYNRNIPGNSAWIIEAAIPWAGIMPIGSDPENINDYTKLSFGFDVLVNDSDGDSPTLGSVDGQLAWDLDNPSDDGDRTEESVDTNIFAFGIVRLKGTMLPGPPPLEYFPPISTSDIPAVTVSPIVVDGLKDDHDWSPYVNLTLFNSYGYDGPNDISASVSYCWTKKYLYIFADITDNSEISWDGSGDLRDYDNLEVYIDLDTFNTVASYGESTVRLLFSSNYNSIVDPVRATRSDFSVYARNKTSGFGWVLEAAIPWKCVLPAGSASDAIVNYTSKTIGFDIHVNDCDDMVSHNQMPDKQLAWDLDDLEGFDLAENFAATNRFAFGLVNLTGTPISGIEKYEAANDFQIVPNPATNSLTVLNLFRGSNIEILTLLGQSMINKLAESESEIIDITSLKPGIYFIRITIDDKQSEILKFIKK